MNITITPTESAGVSRRLQITVPADTVASYEDQAARKYATQVRLPGFRPGKAPPSMVRKKFPEAVRQEAIEFVINEALREAIEREGLKLAAQPHVHDLKAPPGQPLVFELHCEVRPELALAQIDGFTVSRPPNAISDERVEEQIEKLREQKAEWTLVTEKPAPGDMVTVLLSTSDADGTLPEGKEYRIVLGGGQAIAGIEELIMETLPGGTTERNVRWPEDFPDESQRGATKMVRVVVTDVKRKALPTLDDAFAREVGDFDTVEALRTAVKTDMGEHAKREADAEVRGQLIEQIISANPFDVPKAWVMQLVDGYMEMYRVPEAQKQTFAQEFMPMAERQVRRDLIVDTLSAREGLTATAAEVDTKVEELAKARNVEPGQVYAQLQKNGRLQELEREITEERVFTWLLEKNPVSAA
jgi:trigger factor